MKKVVVIIFLLLLCQEFFAQKVAYKDSLKLAYLAEKNDSIKIEKHLAYIHALLYDYEKQKETQAEIESLKKETRNTTSAEIIFWTFYYEGLSEYNNYHYINSIIANERLNRMIVGKKISERAREKAPATYITIGLSYSMLNDLENAQANYQKAIKELQVIHDSSNIVLAYLNMGYLFTKSQDWVGAKNIFEKGLLYLNEEVNKNYSVPLYTSLSTAYSRLGNSKEAATALAKAARLKKDFSSVVTDAFYELALGEYALLKSNYADAINAFNAAVDFSRRWGDTSSVAESLVGLGRAYWKLGNNSMALQSFQLSKSLAVNNRIPDQEKIALKTLFDFYKADGLYKEAAETADSLLLLGDKLNAIQNNNRRIIVNALFESEQRTQQISSLQQENELSKLKLKQKSVINYILAGTAISILLISLLSLGNYRKKKQLQQQHIAELEKEKQLLATEAVMKGQEDERSRLAKDLHDGLGGMLSGIKYSFSNMKDNLIMTPENMLGFERGLNMLDSSISELRRVAHSMMPEALMKFGLNAALKDFCTSINGSGVLKVVYQSYGIDDLKIEQAANVTIYRIVQELLNNVIKHAAANKAVVQVNKEGNKLLITVEDDGKGFDTALLHQSQGIGWTNIQNRLDYLKATLDVQSGEGKGTSVNIEITV
jgi:signal transduction histidine kinase